MEHLVPPVLPVVLLVVCVTALALGMLVFARIIQPGKPGRVTRMPYESGMDPIHDTRRRFNVRFHLLAIAFLVFDVELLFLYPWAVASGQRPVDDRPVVAAAQARADARVEGDSRILADTKTVTAPTAAATPNRHVMFAGAMTFVALLTLGYVYDWRKGVFQWR